MNDSGTRGLSKLTEVAVKPKPIERQKVDTCLRVFCDETVAALTTHPSLSADEEVQDTAKFVRTITDMWTILNVRSLNKDIHHANPLKAVIKSPDDPRLDQLVKLADMFALMERKAKSKRTKHEFVMLGEFNNDPIERLFGQIRQGSGGTYFVSALSTLEKLDIMKAKLLLKLNAEDVLKLDTEDGHIARNAGTK